MEGGRSARVFALCFFFWPGPLEMKSTKPKHARAQARAAESREKRASRKRTLARQVRRLPRRSAMSNLTARCLQMLDSQVSPDAGMAQRDQFPSMPLAIPSMRRLQAAMVSRVLRNRGKSVSTSVNDATQSSIFLRLMSSNFLMRTTGRPW